MAISNVKLEGGNLRAHEVICHGRSNNTCLTLEKAYTNSYKHTCFIIPVCFLKVLHTFKLSKPKFQIKLDAYQVTKSHDFIDMVNFLGAKRHFPKSATKQCQGNGSAKPKELLRPIRRLREYMTYPRKNMKIFESQWKL